MITLDYVYTVNQGGKNPGLWKSGCDHKQQNS